MPATHRHPSSTNTRVSGRFLAADTTTWHLATVPQLHALTAESLHLHLSTRNLVTTGNKTVLAQQLYENIHSTDSPAAVIVSSPTTQSMPLLLAGSDSPYLNTTNAAATTTTANSGQVTTTSASNASLVVPLSTSGQLQPQHLANLLCQAALQLSGNLSHVLAQLQLPTETLVPPATTLTAVSQATASNQSPPPQQEDQLSEASALIPTNPSPGTLIPPISTTTTRNPPPLDTTLDPTSSLPPVPVRLRERIIAGEFIDFNTLLTGAMFSTRDSPTLYQSPAALQMSHQSSEFHVTQTSVTIK